ncbi:MAG: AGE family epimerase/isomerase [candidate division Zixibacteria bacterium]|nr:AGE family epimerase/isomerase [candidate division Zixibacteria bacterium]
MKVNTEQKLDGAFWQRLALDQLIPLWLAHGPDKEHGAFHLNLARDWRPFPPANKMPAMISRQVFGFSAAYLLSGEDRYLDAARAGVDYLLERAWDTRYGGWFDLLSPEGEPLDPRKSIPCQLYTNVGLTLYYFVAGDPRALSAVNDSVAIQQTAGYDRVYGGYFQSLNRDLSVDDDSKNKHAHYGYVGSLTLNLWLATHDPGVMRWQRELTDLTLERMRDEYGWIHGFNTRFNRQWQRIPPAGGWESIPVGGQLTAALSFLGLYRQTGEDRYRVGGLALGERVTRYGWDSKRGGWLDNISAAPPHTPDANAAVSWWVQIYGSLLQLHLYHLTGEQVHLERFVTSARFYNPYFTDPIHGGLFDGVSPDGALLGDGRKAQPWRTSYHEMEFALLCYLYLNLYVDRKPATLHFRLDATDTPTTHYVSLVDEASVRIAAAWLDGQPTDDYDKDTPRLIIPAGRERKAVVELKNA